MDVTDSNRCPYPFKGVHISPLGSVAACCKLPDHHPFGNLRTDSMSNILNSDKATEFRNEWKSGKIPKVCQERCYPYSTIRNWGAKFVKNLDIKNDCVEDIVFADITFGNVCNLTCSMCDDETSHSWAKVTGNRMNVNIYNKNMTMEMLPYLKNIKILMIRGGEPFLFRHLVLFLEELAKINENVQLKIVSNLTSLQDAQIEVLKKFTSNHIITFSVEGTGDMYRYIRGGRYDLDDAKRNIERLKKGGIIRDELVVSTLLMLYNNRRWVADCMAIAEMLKREFDISSIFSVGLLKEPKNHGYYLLKKHRKEAIRSELQAAVEQGKILVDGFETLIKMMDTDIYYPGVTMDAVRSHMELMDRLRGFKLLDIEPNVLDDVDPLVLNG